jgi:hypothetical protein
MRRRNKTQQPYAFVNGQPANDLTDPEQPEQEGQEKEKPEKVRFSDYLLLTLTGYGIILIPTVLFLVGMCLLAAWLFGVFR